MAPGRRLTRSMPPVVVNDQSRCCRGETSDLSSPRDASIHSHSPGETSVQSEPSTPHTPSSVGSNVSGRGPTRGKGLDKLIRAAGHKLKVDIDPVLGRPIDEVQSAKLSSELGVLTRDSIAKKYNKWSEVPKTDEDELFTRLNMRIDVNTSAPHAKRTCTELAMARMRSSNYELHKLFKKYSSVDEARAHCPVGLSQPDWDKKYDYFSSESFKKRSETNKKNRAQQTVTHCMGSRSFVVGKAKKEKEYGRPLGRCEWWKCSRHTDANGWCCDQARVIHEEMEERLNQPVSEGETRPTEDEVADCVLGKKPGYVKGLGHGPRPIPCSSQTVSSGPDQEVISLRGIVESQQEIISRMAAEQAEMVASQAAMAASQEQMKQFIEQLMRQNPQPSPAPST